MKTITEFAALTIKNAAKTRQELVTAGKTPEELPAALGEALKLEGDKLKFMLNALETVGEKFNDLKRIIVLGLNEGEKAPSDAKEKDGSYYRVEYYPSLAKQGQERGHKGHGGKRDDRGGKRKRRGGGRGGERSERGGAGMQDRAGGGGGGRSPRRPRGDQQQQQKKPEGGATPAIPKPRSASSSEKPPTPATTS